MIKSQLAGCVGDGYSHALGVIDVFTEDDGFLEGVGGIEEPHDALGDELGALVKDEEAVHVLLVVGALLDVLSQVIGHARWGSPAFQIFVEVVADDFVGCEEAVINSLFELVGVNGLAEVGNVRSVFGFLRGGREADLDGVGKVVENFTPSGVFGGAASVALVDYDEVEEVTETDLKILSSSSGPVSAW